MTALLAAGGASRLTLVPISLSEAQAFVAAHHRHHMPSVGHKFSLAVADETGARSPRARG